MKVIDQILVASHNNQKIMELQTIASEFNIQLVAPAEYAKSTDLKMITEVEETGTTYYENAKLKALAFLQWANCPVLADDSGLEVTALNNQPGIYSKRFAGENAKDTDRIEKLLLELQRVERQTNNYDRSAAYCCSLVLLFPNGTEFFAEARILAKVAHSPRGERGFGYDPVIILEGYEKTFAEMEFSEICQIDHRGVAAKKLFRQLTQNTV